MNLIAATVLLGNLVVSGTAPVDGELLGCGGSLSAPLTASSLTIVLVYFGPSLGIRFLTARTGQRFIFVENVLPGDYEVRAWAKSGPIAGCDTTLFKTVGESPTVVTQ